MKKLSRCLIIVTVFVNAACVSLNAIGQQDDLFSTVRASSVFSEGQTSSATGSAGSSRLTSAEELVQALQAADFTTTLTGDGTATTTKTLDSWQFPVLVKIADEEQDLLITIGLRAVKDPQKLSASRLLRLLEGNQKAIRASFVFNREQGRLELRGQVRNAGENHRVLREEINRLAILARDNETLWNLDEESGGRPMDVTSSVVLEALKLSPAAVANPWIADSSSPRSADLSLASLLGRWSASRTTTEAFAVQFNADSTFVLVSVVGGKQSRSSGRFGLQNNQLSLDGSDGTKMIAVVKLISASELLFTQQTAGVSGTALSFRKTN